MEFRSVILKNVFVKSPTSSFHTNSYVSTYSLDANINMSLELPVFFTTTFIFPSLNAIFILMQFTGGMQYPMTF